MNMTKTQVTQAAAPHPEIAKLAQFLTAQTLEFMAKYDAPEFQHDQKLHAELAKLMATAKCLPVIQAEIDALRAEIAALKSKEATLIFTDAAQESVAKYLDLLKNAKLGGAPSGYAQAELASTAGQALARLLADNGEQTGLDKMLAEVEAEKDAG